MGALTSRITLLPVSAMNRSPAESTATPVGSVQFGGGGRTVVAAVAVAAVAGDGGDHAASRRFTSRITLLRVGDEQVPGGVHRDARGPFSSAAVAWPPSPLSRGAAAGDGGDHAGG